MNRYSIIREKMPREFLLLQGKGCRWGRCTFCDYHTDTSENPYEVNRPVLQSVTGEYGVLDIINSGSAMELDNETIQLIKQVVEEKQIHTLWFEAHYMYRLQLNGFAEQFKPAKVKFRCGVETFDGALREAWKKGIGRHVSVDDIAHHFQGVCLLCGTQGENRQHVLDDIQKALDKFEYFSINLFCNNSTPIKRDDEFAKWFIKEVYPTIKDNPKVEVLIGNTDLGVG